MNKKFTIPFGSRKIEIEVPEKNFAEYLGPHKRDIPNSEIGEIERALDNPIGSRKIEEIVKPTDSVCLICEDITRFAQTDKMMEQVVKRLNKAGIPDDKITIIMALGSHRNMTVEEMKLKTGEELYKRLKVYNSEFKDEAKLKDMGETSDGVHIWLDKRVSGFDVKIGFGSIVPHTAAGFSGGAKIIYPGVTGEKTVEQFHLNSALIGNLVGEVDNPSRTAMEQWVETVGLDFIVNAVVTPDNRIYKIVAGHYVEAHRSGVGSCLEIYGIKAREKVDVVIVSSHTADWDLWQAGKGITNAEKIVRDGGFLLLITPCPEGAGPHPAYINAIANENPDEILRSVKDGKSQEKDILGLVVGSSLNRICSRINVGVFSPGLSPDILNRAGMVSFSSYQEGLDYILKKYGDSTKISVVPMGGDSFVYV